jgi:hypothetical protein
MRLTIALVGLFLLMPITGRSDSLNTHDGVWWDGLEPYPKTMFVVGYVDGISRADALLEQTLSVKKMTLEAAPYKAPLTSFLKFYRITYKQFVDGLNVFYSDYRNKQIDFDIAILYIRDQIQGTPQKELDSRLDDMRQGAASPKQ